MTVPVWVDAMQTAALRIMRDGAECVPTLFIEHDGGRVDICSLTGLEREGIVAAVIEVVRQYQPTALAMVAAAWSGTAESGFRPVDDPLRQSTAIFSLKQRGRPTVAWQAKYEQVDGEVVRTNEFEFVGTVASVFFDQVLP